MPRAVSTPTSAPRSDPARSEQQIAILGAAVQLLRTEGASGLTVRNVAARAGCSTTGVYTWFGGKNGLVDAIYVDGFDSFDAALAAVDGEVGPTWLVNRGLAYRRWALSHPTEYQVMFTRIVPDYEPGDQVRARGLRSFASHVESIRAVQTAGHLVGPNTEAVAYHVWATIHGHVMLELAGMDGDTGRPNDQRIAEGLQATLAGYGR